jgi:hypothetical protein
VHGGSGKTWCRQLQLQAAAAAGSSNDDSEDDDERSSSSSSSRTVSETAAEDAADDFDNEMDVGRLCKHGKHEQLQNRKLLVDECSMIALPLAAALFNSIK